VIIRSEDVAPTWPVQDEFVDSLLSRHRNQKSAAGGSVVDASLAPSLAPELADNELLALTTRGDVRAFEGIYERHCGAAFSLAHRICREPATAEEATQDAFLAVWRNAGGYEASRGSCRTWILGIVRNRSIDALRRGQRHDRQRATDEGVEELRAPLSTEGEVTRREQGNEVHEALRELPIAQRRVIELAYFGGLSQTEIAGLLGDPLGTVKGRMRLGLMKLRPLVEGTALSDA